MIRFFDYILQGSEATEENAVQAARSMDWQDMETEEGDYPNLQYVGTVNGVSIYYNYGSDDYYFADENAEDDYEPEEKLQDPIQHIDALGSLGSYSLNEDEYNLEAILKQLERVGNIPSSEEISNIKSAIERDNFKKNSLKKESKMVKITMEQLKSIIKEGVARLHRQKLIENRIGQINEELGRLSEKELVEESFFDMFKSKKNTGIDLKNLETGETIRASSKELEPFKLRLTSSGHATSDQPELKGMVFRYENDSITRIK